jgi:O-antigen/teichoic acid export membrane protein
VLTIVWVVVGYFSLFDFGLGAALTRMVAERIDNEKRHEIPSLFWISLALMFLLGLLGSAIMFLICPWLVHHALKIPPELQAESLSGFYVLGAVLPIIVTTTGLRGALEAQQRFGLVNAVRIPMGAFIFAGPVMVLPFSKSLAAIVPVLAAGRVMALVLYLGCCLKTIPALRKRVTWDLRHLGYALRFGGWMTISNVISPVLVYMDRLMIASLVSVAAVAYYATPFEVVSRFLTIPSAVAGVLFPAFTVSFVQDPGRMALLLARGQKYIYLIIFPSMLVIVTLASDGLRFWLGNAFAQNSASILQWLAVGVFVNCLAQVPWVLIQGAGRPDLTAKFHCTELIIYIPVLWFMVRHYGVQGAAVAWTCRVLLDTSLLIWTANRFLKPDQRFTGQIVAAVAAALAILFLATLPITLLQKTLFLVVVFSLLFVAVWRYLLAPDERRLVSSLTTQMKEALGRAV